MLDHILDNLTNGGFISSEAAAKLKDAENNKPFSLHWELKTMLYLGVVLLNIGLGYLIYQNVDTIGHAALIAAICLICAACFFYAARNVGGFTWQEAKSLTPFYDYAVLLGCLTFLSVEGYLQFQYNVFGTQYSLAALIPVIVFFPVAYFFDHRGALSLAIVALGSWVGLTITPMEMLSQNDFSNHKLLFTGIALGVILSIIGLVSTWQQRKPHFAFTYINFGIHLFFISSLAALFSLSPLGLYATLLLLGVVFYIFYATKTRSFYFYLIALLYGYIGLTYLVFKVLDNSDSALFLLLQLYFLVSGVLMILILARKYKEF
jgi:Predicted membrane protein (DUF2157)